MAQKSALRRRTGHPPVPTSERKIYFYRAITESLPDGRPTLLDMGPILTHIESLSCTVGERYLQQSDGNVLCAWVDPAATHPRLRLATVRRSGLPLLEEGGVLTPLRIADAAGLYEPIHIGFFPNNIVGVEFNFYGPRPSRLPAYLAQTATHLCPPFNLAALLRQDVTEQLNRMQQLKVLALKVRSSYASVVAQADRDLGAALEAAARVGDSDVVQLVLQPEPFDRRSFLGPKALRAVRRLVGRSDLHENALSFSIKGLDDVTERIEEVDILKDELVASKKIIRMDYRSRALDDAAAYAAIEEAYEELATELQAAASAQIQ